MEIIKAVAAVVRKVPCEVYSRVVGYFRPVNNWNLGKKAEFADRVTYDAKASLANAEKRDIIEGEDKAA